MQTTGIWDFLSRIDSEELVALAAVVLAILAGIIIAVTSIISTQIRRYRERQLSADLAQDMLDRGMSADEIAQVLRAAAIESSEASLK
jgi:cell division protein FtsL